MMGEHDMGFLTQEPFEAYLAESKNRLSSHQLTDFMDCPLGYRRKKLGLTKDRDTAALMIGRSAHIRILEGRDEYERRYVIGGPINPSTGRPFGSDTKKFREWVAEQGRDAISESDAELIEAMHGGVCRSQLAMELLSEGVAEGVVRAEYCGFPCQIRIDWFHPSAGIVDLKTCDDLRKFEAALPKSHYIHQLAFYRAILETVTGVAYPASLIAVEKRDPWRCGVFRIMEDRLMTATDELLAAIRRLHRAYETDVWETGYEELRYVV